MLKIVKSSSPAIINQFEIPETFSAFLVSHGVNLYSRASCLSDYWVKFCYNRGHILPEANHQYMQLRNLMSTLSWHSKNLNENWGILLDASSTINLLHSLNWNNAFKAVQNLKGILNMLPNREIITQKVEEAEVKAREEWVCELLEEAHKQNATFVVLKMDYYQHPYDENVKHFEECIQKRQMGSILMMCMGFVWLCCPVEELSKLLREDPRRITMHKNGCTVEFISD